MTARLTNEQSKSTQCPSQNALFPNRPHPALEYMPLYFCAKGKPRLLNLLRQLYVVRWNLLYPFQQNVPLNMVFGKSILHATYGEAFFLLPFWAAVVCSIIYGFVYPSVPMSGQIARAALIACFVFAQRNSFVTFVVGVPVERTLFYHKLSGRIGFLATLCHAYAFFVKSNVKPNSLMNTLFLENSVNTSGTVMMMTILGIILSSLPKIREKLFEVFYYLHIVFISVLIACTFYHSGVLIPVLAVQIWGFDLLMRYGVMAWRRYPKKAILKVLSDTVVELSFHKGSNFDYNPGQYMYINIPELSMWQWHPFSISSCPKHGRVTMHIRRHGGWTKALHDLAKERALPTVQREVSLYMEGPYGSLGVDLVGDRYKLIMLIGGGIGLTPMQSICEQLLFEQAKQRRHLKRLQFVWTDRDAVMIQEAPVVQKSKSLYLNDLSSSTMEETSTSQCADPDHRIKTSSCSNEYGDAKCDESPHLSEMLSGTADVTGSSSSVDGLLGCHSEIDEEMSIAAARNSHSCTMNDTESMSDITLPGDLEPWEDVEAVGDVLDLRLFSTSSCAAAAATLQVNEEAPVMYGRPNIVRLFSDMREEALRLGELRVAVCVCGPRPLMSQCRKASLLYSDDKVCFDFHGESMGV